MNCNCWKEVETNMLERLKEQRPEATEHAVVILGRAMIISEDMGSLKSRSEIPMELRYTVTTKAGATKRKIEKSSFIGNYCPMCGTGCDDEQP